MGVHGLRGLLRKARVDHPDDHLVLPHGATLAIDGNGLLFHLFRLAYQRHRQDILSHSSGYGERCKALQAQLLLPSLTPLSLLHEVATSYLTELTTRHGMRLRIFFDGPEQKMKWRVRKSRRERRSEEWENVQRLCQRGILPEGDSGPSKFRSSARKQARDHARRSSGILPEEKDEDAEEMERYLEHFPLSPLAMEQIQRSIYAYAELAEIMLPPGTVEIVECHGEADADVAKASARDIMGTTYALGNDSDYLIYGSGVRFGEAKYLEFCQVDPSADMLVTGNALTRSEVASAIGLPGPASMIELSILLGNDYTSPFVKEEDLKKRQECWHSLMWYRGGEGKHDSLPPAEELSFFDIEGIVQHVAEKTADGWQLTSEMEELRMAIEFSYDLYSFGDISGYPSAAPKPTEEEIEGEDESESDRGEEESTLFPSLPPELNLRLTRDVPSDANICYAALLPLKTYMSQRVQEPNGLDFIEQRHLDAFRMTVGRVKSQSGQHIEPPRRKMQWVDVQSLYVLEKCLLEAIDRKEEQPRQVFDQSIFHSFLESLSFEDFPLDLEVVANHEKNFLEEATSEFPAAKANEEKPSKTVLPIDHHRHEILHTVQTQRVTIIHGETGCGKSSRVPCFLLRAQPPEPTRAAPEVKMIISQPRRIAAKALAERVRSCEPDLADKVGLRMGHGIREYETSKTRAWFVTTGYVVRLLANHPSWFDSHTHLIIDEVHERSVDTDILCLLCRRLLQSHPTIRLVLMSATMAAELYNQYFGVPQPPIHVGARRFPIKEFFVEDLASHLSLSSKSAKLAHEVYSDCEKKRCGAAPSANIVEKMHHLASTIASSVGDTGSSVLIFVPGMADIEAITELIERLSVPSVDFICLPIHSDVPFEEQMAAFEPPKEGEVKVIIATNAAESSLTLPDVDHVVCLGLCKQIVYDPSSHRQMLVPTWISRASATQRAGRTGRVREGTVYRLYSRNAFYSYMSPFDQGEMARVPLDSTILSLRDMLNEEVTPILLECLEPPNISTIDRSFQSLHASNFISHPSDEGEITSLGSLVVALGIDLTLGAFVGLGIQFGVTAEAVQLAAILSFPKTPWAISSPMYHTADVFNEIVSTTFTSRCFFDAGLYSEPMGIMHLLHAYSNCRDRNHFCWKQRVSASRMKHLYGTVQSLTRRVANCLNINAEVLEVDEPPHHLPNAKINILRILQVWLFNETMITQPKSKVDCVNGSLAIELDGPPIGRDHLEQILDERHPFELKNVGKIVQQGSFGFPDSHEEEYFDSFEIRFASYVLDKNVDFAWYIVGSELKIVVSADVFDGPDAARLRESIIGKYSVSIKELSYLQNNGSGNQRGWRGRACGGWHPLSVDSILASDESSEQLKQVYILSTLLPSKKQVKEFKKHVDAEIANKYDSVKRILSCSISEANTRVLFTIASSGECHQISDLDLSDMFAASDLAASTSTSTSRQSVVFSPSKRDDNEDGTSNSGPLIDDAPEGARLMSVLASERRRDNFIRFADPDQEFIDINLQRSLSINGGKWKRKGSGGMCFVPENNVPIACLPTDSSLELFACCANTLELRGGACRVEGITMLPAGRMFVGLALLSFGVNPLTGGVISSRAIDEYTEEKKEAGEMNPLVRESLWWIYEKGNVPSDQQEQWRIEAAIDFHASCMSLGETLQCQPDKIRAMCAFFDGVGGPMTLWDGYEVSLHTASASLRSKKSVKKADRQRDLQLTAVDEGPSGATSQKASDSDILLLTPQSTIAKKKKKPGKTVFTCDNCTATFSKRKALRKHRETCCPDGTPAADIQPTAILSPSTKDVGGEEKQHEQSAPGLAPEASNGDTALSAGRGSNRCPLIYSKQTLLSLRDSKHCMCRPDDFPDMTVTTGGARWWSEAPQPAPPSIDGKPKETFACVGCNEMFSSWNACKKHRELCCPEEHVRIEVGGNQHSREEAIALASRLQPNTPPLLPTNENDESAVKRMVVAFVSAAGDEGVKLSHLIKAVKGFIDSCQGASPMRVIKSTFSDDIEVRSVEGKNLLFIKGSFQSAEAPTLRMSWACEGCKEVFLSKDECARHIETCCFGLVSNTEPKPVYAHNESVASPEQGRSHSIKCDAEAVVPDDANAGSDSADPDFNCHVCNVTCPNSLSFGEHLNSKKHKMRALRSASSECKVCNKIFTSPSQYEQHLSGKKHKKQAMRLAMTNGNSQMTEDPGADAGGNGGVDIMSTVTTTAAAAAARARARAAALTETSEERE